MTYIAERFFCGVRVTFRGGSGFRLTLVCGFEFVLGQSLVVARRTPHERSGDDERHGGRNDDAEQDDERFALGSHREYRNDAARGCRGDKSRVEQRIEHYRGGGTEYRSDNQHRTREDIRKIDFVDAAEKLNQGSTGSGTACRTAAERPIGEQNSETRSGVGFEQEHYRFAELLRLRDAYRRKDAVVDGVIEEHHLRRLDENGDERQQMTLHHRLDTRA